MPVVVKFEEFALVDCSDAELALDGGDEGRSLEKGAREGLDDLFVNEKNTNDQDDKNMKAGRSFEQLRRKNQQPESSSRNQSCRATVKRKRILYRHLAAT